jgi:hypothetical protein
MYIYKTIERILKLYIYYHVFYGFKPYKVVKISGFYNEKWDSQTNR